MFRRKHYIDIRKKQEPVVHEAKWIAGGLARVVCSRCGCLCPKDEDDEWECVSICPCCGSTMLNGNGKSLIIYS